MKYRDEAIKFAIGWYGEKSWYAMSEDRQEDLIGFFEGARRSAPQSSGVLEEVKKEVMNRMVKIGNEIQVGNNISGSCPHCNNHVAIRDRDIPVRTTWIFKEIERMLVALLSRHTKEKT